MPPMVELKDEGNCTTSQETVSEFEVRLAKLEKLKGKIPNEQYNAKMQEILNSI